MAHAFVGLPDDDEPAFLYEHDGDKVRQVLWADFMRLDPAASTDPGWTFVLWGASSGHPTRLKIKSKFVTDTRLPLQARERDAYPGLDRGVIQRASSHPPISRARRGSVASRSRIWAMRRSMPRRSSAGDASRKRSSLPIIAGSREAAARPAT